MKKKDVHVVISSDPEQLTGCASTPLFDCAPVFIASSTHKLAQKAFIDAQDFCGETLITYPLDRARLDVSSQLLTPAKVVPAQLRSVELTAVILMLVASNRGVLYCRTGSCER